MEISLLLLDWKTPLSGRFCTAAIKAKTRRISPRRIIRRLERTLGNTGDFAVIFDFVSCPEINPFHKLKRLLLMGDEALHASLHADFCPSLQVSLRFAVL